MLLVHLPVGDGDGDLRQHFCDAGRGALDVLDDVVEIVDLPAALDLAPDRVGHHVPVVLHDEGLHRHPVLRRLLQRGHVPQSAERHVQRPGDGRGGEGQHVHAAAHLLQAFLVGNAEALLLIHHQKPQMLEADVLLQKRVGADDDVH